MAIANEASIFVLVRLMRYRVKSTLSKGGREVLVLGFLADNLYVVTEHIYAAECLCGWIHGGFAKLGCMADIVLVDEPKVVPIDLKSPLKIRRMDGKGRYWAMTCHIPVGCDGFLSAVQKELRNQTETE